MPARDILIETGRCGMVGAQEDMLEDTALTLAKACGFVLQPGLGLGLAKAS